MSARKRAWVICGGYVIIIYSTLSIMRPVLNILKALLGDFFGLSVSLVPLIMGLIVIPASIKIIQCRNLFSKVLFFLCICVYCVSLYYLKIPEERIHLIEYGLLAVLVLRALGFDIKNDMYLYGLSFMFTGFLGSVDELIQHLLPNRVGDVRDIVLNAFSGLLGLMLVFSLGDDLIGRKKSC